MPNEDIELGKALGSLSASVNSIKEIMTAQHSAFGAKLDTILARSDVIDRKAEKALEAANDANDGLAQLRVDVHEIKESKKKIIWTVGGIGIGSAIVGNKVFNVILGMFQ